jgi:hypothetical protein
MIGQTLSHYKILEKLGKGGMGVVHVGRFAESTSSGQRPDLQYPAMKKNEDQ